MTEGIDEGLDGNKTFKYIREFSLDDFKPENVFQLNRKVIKLTMITALKIEKQQKFLKQKHVLVAKFVLFKHGSFINFLYCTFCVVRLFCSL